MKTSWTALVVVGAIALVDPVDASCKSSCQSQLVHYREEACQKWRERLPRPDLFNHCGQGFNKGKTAGCEGFCKEVPDMGVMKSLRLDACTSLKGLPPIERQQACQAGFSAALDLAKDAADPAADKETAKTADTGSQATATDAGTGAKPEETGDTKRKVNVKNIIPETDRRNMLEDARKEAVEAFANVQNKGEL
ncbi:hypothetical protein GN244_ATG00158 [Phytophthora infestans]|uniref:Secreted protein n=1 Tax=Phytophthora infestans TaxID=4787 RepID=A0A833S8N2_PHYIN|nr:hypothetical protein GN244_ATG11007 [Phytophthora infestans]KAF4047376.1 hypothetical protein GN244_ATG00158 [Phytophthora infestans]KAI9986793.1 hypothetical protein PInf_025754 [Phytophthora infestans]